MKVSRLRSIAAGNPPSALIVGKFDGIHCGHRELIHELRAAAARIEGEASLLTFEPHPSEYFLRRKRQARAPRAFGFRDRVRMFAGAGIDHLILAPFNARFASIEAEEFVRHVLVERLNVKSLIVGADFRFGAERRGDVVLLKRLAAHHGFELRVMPAVSRGGVRVSSTLLREALGQGDLGRVRYLLGQTYSVAGRMMPVNAGPRDGTLVNVHFRSGRHQIALRGSFYVLVHGLEAWPVRAIAKVSDAFDGEPAIFLRFEHSSIHALDRGTVITVEFSQAVEQPQLKRFLAAYDTRANAKAPLSARPWVAQVSQAPTQPFAAVNGPGFQSVSQEISE